VTVTDPDGAVLGSYAVQRIIANHKKYPGTLMVQLEMPAELAEKAVGIRIQETFVDPLKTYEKQPLPDEAVICRCERITAGEIRSAIGAGVRDINQLKAVNRATMGSCGAKTCRPMIWRIFQEEGVAMEEITDRVDRPLFVEVSMGVLAGVEGGGADA
jgi:bacterioferritin-associated ferredoxin